MKIIPGKGVFDLPTFDITKAKRNFPDFLAAYRQYTRGHEATAKVHMWAAVSVLAAALERKVWLDRGYFKLFPNLYIFIIGAPGLVKKSTSTSIGVDLLRDLPTVKIMAERVTAASLIDSMQRSHDKFEYKGAEIKHSSVYCYASELTVFMEEVAGNTTDLLTTFYDCQPNDSTKPWIYETKGQGQVKVFGPCLNMLGCSTPAWLKRAIPIDQMEGGFASRILFVIENELPDVFVAIPKVDDSLREMRKLLLEDLTIIHNLRGEFTMDAEATKAYIAWYHSHMKLTHERRHNTRFQGYYGRKGTQIEKLAMILSVSESNSLVIELRHVNKAIGMLEMLEKNMLTGFALGGKNENAEVMIQILSYIQAKGVTSEGDILTKFFNNVTAVSLKEIIGQLVTMQQIRQLLQGGKTLYIPDPNAPKLFDISSDADVDQVQPGQPSVESEQYLVFDHKEYE